MSTFQPVAASQPALPALVRAFRRSPHLHVVLVVYLQLQLDITDRAELRTVEQLASELGVSESQVRRSLRLLRNLGVVAQGQKTRAGRQLVVFSDVVSEQLEWLQAIDAGSAVVDFRAGVIVRDGVECDFSNSPPGPFENLKQSPGTVSTGQTVPGDRLNLMAIPASHGLTPSNDSICEPTSQSQLEVFDGETQKKNHIYSSYSKSVETSSSKSGPPKKRKPLKPARTDPRFAECQLVQEHANKVFGVKHGLVNSKGEAIGDRFDVLWRALELWELTVDQLCRAVEVAAGDPWWSERRINDTTKLFRKLETIQNWLDRADKGVGGGFDRRGMAHAKTGNNEKIEAELM